MAANDKDLNEIGTSSTAFSADANAGRSDEEKRDEAIEKLKAADAEGRPAVDLTDPKYFPPAPTEPAVARDPNSAAGLAENPEASKGK